MPCASPLLLDSLAANRKIKKLLITVTMYSIKLYETGEYIN